MAKLLIINSILNRTSTGIIAEHIGKTAQSHGWDVVAAYGRKSYNSGLNTYRIGSKFDIYTHVIKSRLFDCQGLASTMPSKQLVTFIDAYKPDIIHLHNLHGHYINYQVLFEYLNSTNIKIVWTLHDCWAMAGHCTHFVRTGCDKWLSGCYDCPQTRYYPESYFIDKSRRNYNLKKTLFANNKNLHIVGVSAWIAEMASKSFLRNADIRYIHNGIDLNTFHPTNSKSNEKIRVMGIANGWGVSKGLYDFYRLRELLPLDKYEIVLVGLEKQHFKNLPNGIIGIARTDTVEQLVDIYSSCDALLNLTYADSFPTTNIEALACGTPVITYKTGGSPESIDEKTGIVVEQGDICGIVDAIKTIEEKGKDSFSTYCRMRAERFFDKDKQFMRYIDLYNELLMP